MLRNFITFFLFLLTIAAKASYTYVFVGSYNGSKSNDGLYVYKLDTATGMLSFITSYKVHNPSYLTLSPDGQYIYACTETKTPGKGSVSSFKFERTKGELEFINSRSSEGENPVYVNIDATGKWLIDANYTQAGISLYPLNPDGSIGQIAQHFTHKGKSINAERQEAAHPHAAVFSPDRKYMFFPDLGSDKIWFYEFNAAENKPLSPNAKAPFLSATPGSGPRHMCFHPDKPYAYCLEELSGTVSVFEYVNGVLWPNQQVQAHTQNLTSGFHSADIQISPDGKFLYASNRGEENNIAIFSIDKAGRLKAEGYRQTMGNHPRSFAIEPYGRFLIVANQVSGDLVVFRRDMNTGFLTEVGKPTKVPGASCVKMYRY